MNSKVLQEERSKKLDSGVTLYYGSIDNNKCDIISITGKGKYKTMSDELNYNDIIPSVKASIVNKTNSFIQSNENLHSHFIFTFDMTMSGILYGKSYKFKYTVYVKPKQIKTIGENEPLVDEIAEGINNIIESAFSKSDIEVVR